MENNSGTRSVGVEPSEMQMQTISAQPNNQNGNNAVDDDDSYFSSFPPGYRFMPTEAELVVHYLAKKIRNEPLRRNRIIDVELYKLHPQQLSRHKTQGEGEWYFFTPRERKYPNGNRPARSAATGYWKATGADKPVKTDDNVLVGHRKALVFYEGKPPGGVKTNWMMHEYRMHNPPERQRTDPNDMRLDDWVLCKIYKGKKRRTEESTDEQAERPPEPEIKEPQDDDGFATLSQDYFSFWDNYDDMLFTINDGFPISFS